MHRNKRTYSKRSFLFFLFILLSVSLMRETIAPTISSPATHGRLPAEWHYKALAVNTIYRFPSRKLSTPHFGIFSERIWRNQSATRECQLELRPSQLPKVKSQFLRELQQFHHRHDSAEALVSHPVQVSPFYHCFLKTLIVSRARIMSIWPPYLFINGVRQWKLGSRLTGVAQCSHASKR